MKTRLRGVARSASLAVLALAAGPAGAEVLKGAPGLNLYGATGLIDTPTAEVEPDGTFSTTVAHFAGMTRTSFTFQISPRLSGSFRYTSIANWNAGGFATYYDRSFDIRYQLLAEKGWRPAVTVGLRDFGGTSLASAEYIVATKTVRPGLKVTGGLGWGRLGTYGALGSPFGPRPKANVGVGGKPNANTWFRGPVAPFAGVEWRPTEKLAFKLEYSSDNYNLEATTHKLFRRRSPVNLGVEYAPSASYRVGAYYLYGSEVGVSFSLLLNPRDKPTGGVLGPGAAPVPLRLPQASNPAAWSTGWTSDPAVGVRLRDTIAKRLAQEGMQLDALSVTATRAQLRLRNNRYNARPQAIGRAARILAQTLPSSVETFEIVPVANGIPVSKVTLRRSDLEQTQFAPNAAAQLLARTTMGDAAGRVPEGAVRYTGQAPRLVWSLGPYTRFSFFDPDNPVRADLGIALKARYEITPGLFVAGAITKKVIGNLDKSTRPSNSVLQHVRSDTNIYDRVGDPALERLTLAWYARPGRDLYSRVTVGYLERMFGGVSGEVLWKPVGSRLALGAEVNYVRQRNYNERLGFMNYSVATGHLSAYYEFGRGYYGQIDAGRYLAGDWGATFTFDRIFANGWRVGAFATLTNISAKTFGEGSFDKGIRISIPIAWGVGYPTPAVAQTDLRPLTRDGGARLDVEGRLYDSLRAYHSYALDRDWGRVWR